MDHHDLGRGRGRSHGGDVVHMYVPVRIMVMVSYVRIVMVVMSDVMSYVSSMSGVVSLVMLHVGTSLQDFRLRGRMHMKEIINRPLQFVIFREADTILGGRERERKREREREGETDL